MHDLALPSIAGPDAGDAESLFGLSLCAGAGGLDLGPVLAEPGYCAVGYVERDAFGPEKRMAGNHTVNLANQALEWPPPKASEGNQPSAGKRRDGSTNSANLEVIWEMSDNSPSPR